MIDFKIILDLLFRRGAAEKAKLFAYVVAPGVVLSVAAPEIWGGTFTVDATRTLSVAELKTLTLENGEPVSRPGLVIVVEPTASEYRVPLGSAPRQIWSSLDENAARANRDRIGLDASGVRGRPPFLGTNAPVTFVIEGQPGKHIELPGSTERFENLVAQSRRSVAIVSSVILACVFAFGLSSATALPSIKRNKRGA